MCWPKRNWLWIFCVAKFCRIDLTLRYNFTLHIHFTLHIGQPISALSHLQRWHLPWFGEFSLNIESDFYVCCASYIATLLTIDLFLPAKFCWNFTHVTLPLVCIEKAALFESDFYVSCASYIATLLTIDLFLPAKFCWNFTHVTLPLVCSKKAALFESDFYVCCASYIATLLTKTFFLPAKLCQNFTHVTLPLVCSDSKISSKVGQTLWLLTKSRLISKCNGITIGNYHWYHSSTF